LVRLLLIQPILLGLGGLAMAILNTFRRFLLTSLAPLVYNLSIIAGALFLSSPWGIDGLVAGVLVGAGLYLLVMVPGLVLCRMRFRLSFDWRDAGVREVGRLLGPRLLGQMAFQVNFVAINTLATFQGTLAVTAIDYAYRLLNLPLGILGVSLATVVFPSLAAMANEGQMDRFRFTLTRTLRVVVFLGLPAAALLLVLRVPIVRLLFERGEYVPSDTTATAHALLFFLLGLVAACGAEIILRAFYALHDTRTPVVVAVIAMVLNVALGAGLVQVMGFAGLALSFSVADTVQAAGLLILLKRRLGQIGGRELLYSAVRSLAATLVAAGGVFLAQPLVGRLVSGEGFAAQLLELAAMALLGAGLYLGATLLLRSPELREAWEMVRRRRGG
jgi:putative peptidoglycan lipid II flippase